MQIRRGPATVIDTYPSRNCHWLQAGKAGSGRRKPGDLPRPVVPHAFEGEARAIPFYWSPTFSTQVWGFYIAHPFFRGPVNPPLLLAEHLTCGYGEQPVVRDVSFSVASGDFTGIIGPNGCGKSTLLRTLTGVLTPQAGSVALQGQKISTLSRRDIARQVAVIPQDTTLLFGFTVLDMVLMGRTPHLKRLQRAGEKDLALALEALEQTDMLDKKDRKITELSGGERQRAVIARALAQEPSLLLLDEPDSHLDIGHQVEIFNLLQDLNHRQNLTLLCVSHDLNLAAAYCRRLLLMQNGRLIATGTPEEIITPEHIHAVYGIHALVSPSPVNGTPQITPCSLPRRRSASASS